MTLYDLIKMYGSGNGEEMMWKTIKSISEAVEHSMPQAQKSAMLRSVYGEIAGPHYNEEYADADVEKMYYVDRSGNKHQAPYWPKDAVREIYSSVKSEIKAYNPCDFYVTMNMIASDNWPLLEKWFPGMSQEDRNMKTVELAINWLKDPDAKYPDSKIWHYMSE